VTKGGREGRFTGCQRRTAAEVPDEWCRTVPNTAGGVVAITQHGTNHGAKVAERTRLAIDMNANRRLIKTHNSCNMSRRRGHRNSASLELALQTGTNHFWIQLSLPRLLAAVCITGSSIKISAFCSPALFMYSVRLT
jgi:hypothetical protein